MKITRYRATKDFKDEMKNYQKEFRIWCSNDSTYYSHEFRELIYFGLACGLPAYLVHKLIQEELRRITAEVVGEYKEQLRQQASAELQAKIANYTAIPIPEFSPHSEFLQYLDTVDYKTVNLSTVKTRGYCLGLSIPEIEAMVEEHRTRL